MRPLLGDRWLRRPAAAGAGPCVAGGSAPRARCPPARAARGARAGHGSRRRLLRRAQPAAPSERRQRGSGHGSPRSPDRGWGEAGGIGGRSPRYPAAGRLRPRAPPVPVPARPQGGEQPRHRRAMGGGAELPRPRPRPHPPRRDRAAPAPSRVPAPGPGGGWRTGSLAGGGGGTRRRVPPPPKGVAPLKPPTPLPPVSPRTRERREGAGGTHMSPERRGATRGARAGPARRIPFVPLPWTGEQAGSSCGLSAAPTPALSMETREPCDSGRKPPHGQRQWRRRQRWRCPHSLAPMSPSPPASTGSVPRVCPPDPSPVRVQAAPLADGAGSLTEHHGCPGSDPASPDPKSWHLWASPELWLGWGEEALLPQHCACRGRGQPAPLLSPKPIVLLPALDHTELTQI